jgi:hypothetical protein
MFARPLTPVWLLLALVLALAFASGRAAGGSTAETRYVVKPGDTLWTIVEGRYGGDPRSAVWRVQERNGLAGGSLTPGMVINLPP